MHQTLSFFQLSIFNFPPKSPMISCVKTVILPTFQSSYLPPMKILLTTSISFLISLGSPFPVVKGKKEYVSKMENLESGKTYFLRIKAVNDKGQSPPSEPAKVTTFHADSNVSIFQLCMTSYSFDIGLLSSYSSKQIEQMTIVGT